MLCAGGVLIPLAAALGYLWILAALGTVAWAAGPRETRPEFVPLEFGLATAGALLVAGVAWPHYATWLLPAFGLLATGRAWPHAGRGRAVLVALVGGGAALVAFPFPEHHGLLQGFFDLSVISMSLGNLGLIALFAGLALALRRLSGTDE